MAMAQVDISQYTKEQLLKWMEQMLLLRRFEERAAQYYGMQKIKGFLHLYIGQEAVAVGVEAAIRPTDPVISAYREHGHILVRPGVEPGPIMAELFGKRDGCSKGKGGSMHMFSAEHHFYGGHAIVGGQIPIGTGIAFAIKYRNEVLGVKDESICITYLGDGAVRQGAFHEALNMAMTWKLPVLYVIENNRYAMGTAVERVSNVTELYKLACAYEMPSEPVDGMDVIKVYEATKKAAEHVRSGKGPYLLEMLTYRYRGHSMADPAKYRTKEEVEKYKAKDPILILKSYLMQNNIASVEEIDEIDKKVKEKVKEAIEFAEKSPFPEPHELWEDVYVGPYPFIKED